MPAKLKCLGDHALQELKLLRNKSIEDEILKLRRS